MRNILVALILSCYGAAGMAFSFNVPCGEKNLAKCQTSLKEKFDKICSIDVPACEQQSLYNCVVESDNCSLGDYQDCPTEAASKTVRMSDNRTYKYCAFNRAFKSSVACAYTKKELVNRELAPYQEKAADFCRKFIEDRNCIISSIRCDQKPKGLLSTMKYNFKKRYYPESYNLEDRVVTKCEVVSPNCVFSTADSPKCEKGMISVALGNRKETLCRVPSGLDTSPGIQQHRKLPSATTR